MKSIVIVVAVLVTFAESAYVTKGGQVYLYEPKTVVANITEARTTCQRISAVIPYEFNVTRMNEIGALIPDSQVSFLMDIEKEGTAIYKWSATGRDVASDLWHQGEPQGEGVAILKKKDGKNGLYIATTQTMFQVVCQLDVSTPEEKHALQEKWSDLPIEELEPLEQLMMDLHLHDSLTGVKATIENAKRTKMLLRLIQRIIEA
jgi:hypothetical protein